MRIKIVYKLLVPIIVLMIVSSVVLFVYIASRTRANTIESATQAAVATIDQFKILRGYYTQAVVSKVKAHTDLSISFDHDTDATTIPLPATMIHDLSERFSQVGENTIRLKLYSEYPFSNRADRVLDEFQSTAIEEFKIDPERVFVQTNLLSG